MKTFIFLYRNIEWKTNSEQPCYEIENMGFYKRKIHFLQSEEEMNDILKVVKIPPIQETKSILRWKICQEPQKKGG